jgi:hypothetical protein
MAWALLCAAAVAAVEKPRPFDRAVDVEVAWDLIDLPFTIDAQLLSKKSPLLLQDWESDDDFGFGAPLDKELQALHEQFTSILTNSDASHKLAAKGNPHLRGAVHMSHPLGTSWYSPPFDADAPPPEKPSPAKQPEKSGADDEDSKTWTDLNARLARLSSDEGAGRADRAGPVRAAAVSPAAEDHEDSAGWDLASGQRKARPAATGESSSADGQASKRMQDFFAGTDAMSAFHSSSPRESTAASAKKAGGAKKPLVWIHVHKAGGSFMCQMAKRNERVVAPEENCNWKGHDGYQESGKSYTRVPCAERARQFHSRGFTYGQVEREMDTDEVCDEFRYGVMLREPLALMNSLVNYEIWYNEKFAHKHVNIPGDMVDWMKGKIDHQEVPRDQFSPWVKMDNFQTRVLANAFDVPAGQISNEHLDRARAFLQDNAFTVAILEDLPTQGENLFNEIGWKWQPNALHHKVNALAREERPFMPEENDYLKELNKFDYELYRGMRSSE